jgi:hypothetical protein
MNSSRSTGSISFENWADARTAEVDVMENT